MALLTEKNLLCNLSISQWTARKLDKRITREVAAKHGTRADVGNYNKLLIDKKPIKAITEIVNQARSFHYDHTLPWLDNGSRLLPTKFYMEYAEKISDYKKDFTVKVNDLIIDYDKLIDDAKNNRLKNGLFNPADYPSVSRLRSMYDFNVSFMEVPDTDVRAYSDLTDQDIEKLANDHGMRLANLEQDCLRHCWSRLRDVVASLHDRCSGDDKRIFRDSIISNIEDQCELLKGLNFSDDPDLENMRREIQAELLRFSPQQLRENDIARNDIADKSQAILNKMKAFTK